jgi:hypothetical protein
MVVASFIDSISAIAAGAVGSAAARVEATLAGFLTVVISFLANFIGLGGVGERVKKIIAALRAPVDKALDALIPWIVNMASRVGRFFAQAGTPRDPAQRLEQGLAAATLAVDRLSGPTLTAPLITPVLGAIKVRYGFSTLEAISVGNDWWIQGEINPRSRKKTSKKIAAAAPAAGAAPASSDRQIRVYEGILTALNLALIQGESNPDRYREKMRNAIVAAYAGKTITQLNNEVFRSGAIPRAQNRIRGDIFELWLSRKGVFQRQSPIFEDDTLYKRRIADGVRGTDKLVDAKVRRPNTRPDAEAKRQMEDYNRIITSALKAINVADGVERGPFKKVVYIFSDAALIPLWQSSLVEKLGTNFEAE